jgi:hypothetical protein
MKVEKINGLYEDRKTGRLIVATDRTSDLRETAADSVEVVVGAAGLEPATLSLEG